MGFFFTPEIEKLRQQVQLNDRYNLADDQRVVVVLPVGAARVARPREGKPALGRCRVIKLEKKPSGVNER
jgi:hypothetical protein